MIKILANTIGEMSSESLKVSVQKIRKWRA